MSRRVRRFGIKSLGTSSRWKRGEEGVFRKEGQIGADNGVGDTHVMGAKGEECFVKGQGPSMSQAAERGRKVCKLGCRANPRLSALFGKKSMVGPAETPEAAEDGVRWRGREGTRAVSAWLLTAYVTLERQQTPHSSQMGLVVVFSC